MEKLTDHINATGVGEGLKGYSQQSRDFASKSVIREYVETTLATEGRKGWLRREPKTTHPAIIAAVRDFETSGGHYDDDAERYVERVAGDMPAHLPHGHPERDELTYQLGSEVYIARGLLKDEKAQADINALIARGFAPFDEDGVTVGERYVIVLGTLNSGRGVPNYGAEYEMRARRDELGRLFFLPKGARTRGARICGPALIKAA